eukprot:PITA_28273
MEIPTQVILDNTNYFQWWSYIVDLLRTKSLYRIASGQETKPKDEENSAKWENRQYQVRGLIGMSISPDLRFHIVELDAPDEAMKQITKVFGIKNELRAHQLENELLTFDPNNFSCIEDFLSKFKTIKLLLEGVKVKKEDSALINCILTKLGPAYSVFVSTFHSTREAFISQGHDYKPPSFDAFFDSLIREQEKLLHLGLPNPGNSSKKALTAQQQLNSKNPKKSYPKKNGPKPNKGPKQFQPQNEKSFHHNDKATKNKGKKTDKHCNFCNRDGHLESKCFKKMEALEAAMRKHNIHLEHSSNSSLGMALSACGYQASRSGYALNVSSSSHSHEWPIDSRASYHMAKNKAMFSSLNDCNTKNIYVGDDRSLVVLGTGTVHIDSGQFNDVLCVPTLSCNLLSVYRITHSGEARAHILDEKCKALEPKSEKCIIVGYSEDVKGYRLIPFNSKNVIIRRDVNFHENKSTYEPSSAHVPPLSISSTFEHISSSDDESEDENPPPPSQDPPSAPSLPKLVQATQNAAGDLVGDPTDQHRTRSQFERASSLLPQVSANYDPDTFAEASTNPHWDVAMNEEYRSLLANDTWDLFPLPKGRKLVRCKWVYRTKYGPNGKVDKH